MLKNLKINNYALINNLDINFLSDFTVISGDTGSGKSIILDAMSLLFGKRIDRSKLNTNKCVIEAEFIISNKIISFFEKYDLDFYVNTLIRREINQYGKSRSFINDTPVSVSILSEFSKLVIEIHAQHENLLIKNNLEQLNILDKIACNSEIKNEYHLLYDNHNKLLDKLETFNNKRILSDKDYELYKFHSDEIIVNEIQINEYEKLENKIDTLQNISEISDIANNSIQILSDENYVIDYLSKIKKILSRFDKFKELENRVEANLIDLKDISDELSIISETINNNYHNLDELLNRQDIINKLFNKHNVNNLSDLLSIHESIKKELNIYENFEVRKKKILSEIDNNSKKLINSANNLSISRKKIIPQFEKEIKDLLNLLAMPHASFKIKIDKKNNLDSTGDDNIKFQFSSNPGVSVQDINKIASGGEISRLMLALKYKIANYDGIQTLILDEIDTGVSGKIASYMGDLMKSISKTTQLISVTHLPQIASKSDNHIKVSKLIENNITKTEVRLLNKKERIIEIAKLLSGKKISDAAISNAKELLNQ
jgi:DNA repair protein RecN (Recombination protein N)